MQQSRRASVTARIVWASPAAARGLVAAAPRNRSASARVSSWFQLRSASVSITGEGQHLVYEGRTNHELCGFAPQGAPRGIGMAELMVVNKETGYAPQLTLRDSKKMRHP